MGERDLDRAALRGEPSYVWRAGQQRRWEMILAAADGRQSGRVLDCGCGIGAYLARFEPLAKAAQGLEVDPDRARVARLGGLSVALGVSESLPYADDSFDLILSHEVLEHVEDDRLSAEAMVRALKPGGRLVVFVPNRGYPFETHGVYWRGRYRFGNIPLVNYLPDGLRDRLAPHVRAYSGRSLARLFAGLPVRRVHKTVIFGGYDNVIARWPTPGRMLRAVLQGLERTPMRGLGLSHFWVLEKI
jgi:SAM-dependent methyltransferase